MCRLRDGVHWFLPEHDRFSYSALRVLPQNIWQAGVAATDHHMRLHNGVGDGRRGIRNVVGCERNRRELPSSYTANFCAKIALVITRMHSALQKG
jgi:hypothetical protein